MFVHSWVHSYIPAQSFSLLSFFFPFFKIKAKFSTGKADLQIGVCWASGNCYLKLAQSYTALSSAATLSGVNPHRATRNLIAKNHSALLLVSNCHMDFPFHWALMCLNPYSLTSLELMTERQVIAWSSLRSKAQLQAPHAFPSAILWHSSNALSITGTEPDCCLLPKPTAPSQVACPLLWSFHPSLWSPEKELWAL